MKKITLIFLALLIFQSLSAQQKTKSDYIVLITLDGLRWQEVFTGADSALLRDKSHVKKVEAFEKAYWAETPEARRNKLMPFMWKTIAMQGQIYGNRNIGCKVNVANPYWFSYPGYNEILCGFADEKINTNDFGPNPNINILEFINKQEAYKGKVAAFTSWDAFPDIINEKRSGVLVNSAFENLEGDKYGSDINLLNQIQYQLPDVFYGVRLDAVTFHLGFGFLKEKQPDFLFIALDETDDFAHHGDYDYYLNSARYTDKMIEDLWHWLQTSEKYKDKTTLIITVDHGRGIGSPDWKSHGIKTANSDETWFAVIGPDTPPLGVITKGQYYNNQYAETIAALLGFDFISNNKTGDIIQEVIGKN